VFSLTVIFRLFVSSARGTGGIGNRHRNGLRRCGLSAGPQGNWGCTLTAEDDLAYSLTQQSFSQRIFHAARIRRIGLLSRLRSVFTNKAKVLGVLHGAQNGPHKPCPKYKNGAPFPKRRLYNNRSLSSFFSVPTAAETPASQGAAADTPAVDHGLARESAHSNGWRDRCARAGHFHSTARAAAAAPDYR
jgi:hypothetical protein